MFIRAYFVVVVVVKLCFTVTVYVINICRFHSFV